MMVNNSKKYALFWGCLIPLRLPWIEVAVRKVLPKLGIEIVDLPFSCCPDPIASKSLDHRTWLSLAARNLTLAEERDLDILTVCSGCFETLRVTQKELNEPRMREDINGLLKKIKRQYQGTKNVLHLQQWLYDELGPGELEQVVTHPLSFRVAAHVGCHFTRPADVLQTDDPVFPEQLDELCEVLGLEAVDYPDKNLCCGVGVGLVDGQISRELIRRKIAGALRAGAEAIVAHCPYCIQSYDMGQRALDRKKDELSDPIPVFHYLELLGLAMGMEPEEFCFEEHKISMSHIVCRI